MEVKRQLLASNAPESLGITQKKPKFPQYAVIAKREESFTTWPKSASISSDKLAECGLVYTGVGDSVRCYYCGGGLRNWEPLDDPWVEHATWYPDCPHIQLVKGQHFVERVLNNSLQTDQPLVERKQTPADSGINSVAAQSCIQMGFPENKVLRAINKYIGKHGNTNFKGEDLCSIILDEEEDTEEEEAVEQGISTNVTDSHKPNELSPTETVPVKPEPVQDEPDKDEEHLSYEDLYAENCRLKENQLCKICLDGVASIIFLPCGHMVTCPQCAPAFTKCPMCRVTVTGFVKAYFTSS